MNKHVENISNKQKYSLKFCFLCPSKYQNHLEGLSKHRLLCPTPRISDSAGLKGETQSFAFPTHSQVMLILLIWKPHFEDLQSEICFKKFLMMVGMHIFYYIINYNNSSRLVL